MSRSQWYVYFENKVHGPFSANQMREFARQGKIKSNTKIRREEDQAWGDAGLFKGLFNQPDENMPSGVIKAKATGDDRGKNSSSVLFLSLGFGLPVLIIVLGSFLFVFVNAREKQRKIEEANQSVAKAVADAKEALAKKNVKQADDLIVIALSNSQATEKQAAQNVRIEIENAKAAIKKAKLEDDARSNLATTESTMEEAIAAQDLDRIRSLIDQMKELGNLPDDARVRRDAFIQDITRATSVQHARNTLLQLSYSDLAKFESAGELPTSSLFASRSLNSIFRKICQSVIKDIQNMKMQEKARKMAAEREEQTRQRVGKELAQFELQFDDYGTSISWDRRLLACRIEGADIIQIIDIENRRDSAVIRPPAGLSFGLFSYTAFSPDSKYFAANTEAAPDVNGFPSLKQAITIWDVSTGRVFQTYQIEDYSPNIIIALTNDCVLTCQRNEVRVWSIADGRLVASFSGHRDEVNCIAISPDGRLAVTGGDDKVAIIWEIRTGKEIGILDEHESSIEAVAFSPDGKSILTGGFDCSVRLWDLQSRKVNTKWQLGEFDAVKEQLYRIKRASDSLNATIARQRGQLSLHTVDQWKYSWVRSICFSPTGDRAVVGLSTFIPQTIDSGCNPLVINLVSKQVMDLPSIFQARPLSRVWVAYNSDGTAVIFNRSKLERERGEEKEIRYFTMIGTP